VLIQGSFDAVDQDGAGERLGQEVSRPRLQRAGLGQIGVERQCSVQGGLAAVADTVIAGWLTADFRERDPHTTAKLKAMLLATPVEGYLACCEALSTLDQRALLPEIKSPVLVIAGRHDMATPLSAGELIRSNIPRASLTILDAAHISNVEQSHAFTDAVVGFLTQR